ncbi:tyrosine-type recombinase/integrase [Nocardioides renjunii]|uniref:tyrosine-type recombinase/integrase n=1 Tax=Nocardioides renjunii TaxID=3095075 RepID=UPI0034DB3750
MLPKRRAADGAVAPERRRRGQRAHGRIPHPARVELLWNTPEDEERVAVRLLLTTRERSALNRNYFNSNLWRPAQKATGVEPSRDNGTHALRHWYASVLLDAGESIRAVSEYLGHRHRRGVHRSTRIDRRQHRLTTGM